MANKIDFTAGVVERSLQGDTPRSLMLRAFGFAHFRQWDRIHLEVVRVITPDTPPLEKRNCSYCGYRIHPLRLEKLPNTMLCGNHAALFGEAPLLVGCQWCNKPFTACECALGKAEKA